jgi:phenylpropionate dioxygenase-like ring-hydroxylating dioxygenase large terminal subunit
MIRNQWYAVLESNEVKKNKLTGVTRLGERLVFWRNNNGEPVCLADKCCHRGAAMSAGKMKDGHAQCPFHGFEYDESGCVVLIPANGSASKPAEQFRVNSYKTAERHGMIFIFWGAAKEKLPEVPSFTDIDENFPYVTSVHSWPVHYSRAVENQLDLVHVPFVHYDTIGKGNRVLVNGPVELIKENRQIEFWVYNEKDIGQTPKKASELPPPDLQKQHIHFIFPNIWQNWILPQLRIFVAFVPVDDSNTVIYLRAYQRFMTVPVLRQLFDFFNMRFSKKILNQDRRVVLTQLPIKTELRMDEKLIPGDLPIVTYRRIREELKKPTGM